MKTIWKFNLRIDDDIQTISMPEGAQILSVGLQQGKPMIWAEVDSEADNESRRFWILGTGQPITKTIFAREFIGTFQIVGSIGTLVGHAFEVK